MTTMTHKGKMSISRMTDTRNMDISGIRDTLRMAPDRAAKVTEDVGRLETLKALYDTFYETIMRFEEAEKRKPEMSGRELYDHETFRIGTMQERQDLRGRSGDLLTRSYAFTADQLSVLDLIDTSLKPPPMSYADYA